MAVAAAYGWGVPTHMLEIARFILSAIVAQAHIWPLNVPWLAWQAVFAFYTLSGFLMTRVLHEKYGFTGTGRIRASIASRYQHQSFDCGLPLREAGLLSATDHPLQVGASGRGAVITGNYLSGGAINVGTGTSNHYVITGNVGPTISDGGGGANKSVTGNV